MLLLIGLLLGAGLAYAFHDAIKDKYEQALAWAKSKL